jgi:drug/metabolite transporter (DMT)-like permease
MVDAQVLAGMAAAASAAACFDGAVILQAYEARRVEPVHALGISLLARLVRRPRWLVGTAIAVAGWPLQLVAFALAPVTVVQPCLGLGMLLLLVAGSRALHEPVGRRQWAAAAAVVAGVAALGVSGLGHTDRMPEATGLGIAVGALALAALAPFLIGRARLTAWALMGAGGAAFALTALASKLITIELAHDRPLSALAWALTVAGAGGAGLVIDMTALQRFEATRVAPPMFALETGLPVALAPLLFDERWGTTPGGGALVVAGLLLVLAGGAQLGSSRLVAEAEARSAR